VLNDNSSIKPSFARWARTEIILKNKGMQKKIKKK